MPSNFIGPPVCLECGNVLGNDTLHPGFCSVACKETWEQRDAEWAAEIETESEVDDAV